MSDPARGTGTGPTVGRPVGAALVVVGALVGAGVLVGVVWRLVAPTVVCTTGPGDCPYDSFEGGLFFVAEGWFAVLAAVGGVVAALLARRWLRELGWPVVVALGLGGGLASLVAWRVGVWLGPDDPAGLAVVAGALAERPLRLRSAGLLVVWSIASVLVALLTMLADAEAGSSSGDRHQDGRTDPRAAPDPAELAAWVQRGTVRPADQERSTR